MENILNLTVSRTLDMEKTTGKLTEDTEVKNTTQKRPRNRWDITSMMMMTTTTYRSTGDISK